jgi:tetratricopeptide (TPR) repeat protein
MRRNRLWLLGLVVATFLAYQPVWQAGFVWDDDWHVPHAEMQSWHGLQRIWCNLGSTQQYYPLLESLFWAEYQLWGDWPCGYHLLTISLHAAAVVLVATILRKLEIPGAYLAAAIFALHPVHVESVAWITEMKNTLSAVFYLGAMSVYLRFDRERKASSYLAAAGLFALGLLSKTVIATLPGALLVIFWWQRGRLSWRRDVLPLTLFFGLGAAAGLLTAWMERKFCGAEGPRFDMTLVERCLVAGRGVWFYLAKLFWPADLIFIYPRWQVSPASGWQYLLPAAVLLLLAALWAVRQRWRGPLAGLLFFLGTLFPALGFSNLYVFRYSFVSDHFQYLASLGIITLVSAGATLLARRARWGPLGIDKSMPVAQSPFAPRKNATFAERKATVFDFSALTGQSLCLGLLLTLAVLSWRQSRMYADVETLYRATVQRHPDCLLAHYNLAKHLSATGRGDEAVEHYDAVLRLDPDYPDIHNDLANILAAKGQPEAAARHYREALRLDPRYAAASVNLADMLAAAGKTDEAGEYYGRALQSGQQSADVHNRFGNALAAAGRRQEAMEHYAEALRLDPDYALAHVNLANLLSAAGNSKEAVSHYERALALRPDSAETHNNLGVLLIKLGRVTEAIRHFNQAVRLRSHYAMAEKNLALAARLQAATTNR